MLLLAAGAFAADISKTGLRDVPLDREGPAPRMMPQSNDDVRKVRNYPEQPPVIPHKTEDYQVDARVNECMTCHSRQAVAVSQAPMVSITHFMDRDGQFLASVSPRRYFCNQCHVSQHEVRAPVGNTFVDVDQVLAQPK
jgi:cytochrome c-type protein NapB